MIDYISLFEDYGVEYALEGPNVGTQFIGVLCPWCSDVSFHGGFPRNGAERYTCWRCGTHSVKATLTRLTGVRDIEQILKGYDDGMSHVVKSTKEYREDFTVTVPGGPLAQYHKNYLVGRRYDPEYLEAKYFLRGTHPLSSEGNRIYAPVIFRNEIVSYQGRAINGATPKYKAAHPSQEKLSHKHTLYNIDNCKSDFIVLVEGVYDVFRLGDNSAATFGTAFSEHQIVLAKDYDRVFMLYDSEGDAQQRAKDASQLIATLVKDVAIVDIGEGDPDDLSDDDARALMKDLGGKIF